MPFTKISAVIITKNEANNIKRCIEALQKVSDEIIIVDAFSEDHTVQIARKLGAKVTQKKWSGYSENKNFGNSLAQNDWILSIDADEVLSDELVQSLQSLKPQKGTVFACNRLTNYCGKWIRYSNWHPDWKIRLFHRGEAQWVGEYVHEKLVFTTSTQVVFLEGLLYHYSYQTSADHWQRIEKYAQLSAQQLMKEGKRATLIKLWLSPIARFFRTFLLKKGFLDGKEGWIISIRNAYLVHRKYRLLRQMLTKG